ncbi:hypothetical protein GALL_479890 [mine drainage metagenome]|uniref:Uncharacterized protein n=1 Tax=mine drainage metagenome TaxID=410659 RepID=A0A1J5PHZ3_9ZZZZ
MGPRAGGRRRRVDHAAVADRRSGRRQRHVGLQGHPHPDGGRLRGQAEDPDRRQQQARPALPRAGDIHDIGLQGREPFSRRGDRRADGLGPELAGGEAEQTGRRQHHHHLAEAREAEPRPQGRDRRRHDQGRPADGRDRLTRQGEIERRAAPDGHRGPQGQVIPLSPRLGAKPVPNSRQARRAANPRAKRPANGDA